MAKKTALKNKDTTLPTCPPIVTVLGHVDHGKTTLLDTIRKTDVASREHGGITQRIGAYQVEVETAEGKQKITFIDTPGHEAFAKMRSRGAAVADIAILVVSAVDGVMPQTKEAIDHIRQARIPLIVAINKTDLPEANIEKVKKQLGDSGVLVEGYGGDTVAIPISAKTGTGVHELLEMILLVAAMAGLSRTKDEAMTAVVIESRRDSKRGTLATLIIKSGTLMVGDEIFAETAEGRVRAIINSYGENCRAAYPSEPVEILGFSQIPPVGMIVKPASKEKKEPQVFMQPARESNVADASIRVIIKADALGSLEAVRTLLPPDVEIVAANIGDINESDVLFAKTTGSLIIGFGVSIATTALKLAEFERVMIKTYRVIYELASEINEVVAAIKEGKLEDVLGQGEIVAEFPFDRERIAGVRVKEGRLARGDGVKIVRQDTELGRGKIKSIRQLKEEVNKVEAGSECGILLMPALDFQKGDVIIAYR